MPGNSAWRIRRKLLIKGTILTWQYLGEKQIFWHKGKPAIAAKFMLWENKTNCDPESVAKLISGLPNSPQSDQNSYAVVIVHAWSFYKIGGPIEAVRQTIGMLPNGTRVVSIQDLCYLLRQNCRQ